MTGGRRVLSRNRLGSFWRSVSLGSVDTLRHATEPHLPHHDLHTVSMDEHAFPHITRKFQTKKGYHTLRNKHMPVEKLTFSFHVGLRSLLSLVVSPGDGATELAKTLLHRLRARVRGAPVCVLLDAGAANASTTSSDIALYSMTPSPTLSRPAQCDRARTG